MTAFISVVCIVSRQADPLPTYHVAEPLLDCVCALVVVTTTVQRHRGRLSAAVTMIRNVGERTRPTVLNTSSHEQQCGHDLAFQQWDR